MITVLTATIPGREALLAEAVASVYAQTSPAEEHLVIASTPKVRPAQADRARVQNRLLRAVDTDWVAVLADDNVWLPNHVEAISPWLREADVIYSWDAEGAVPRVDVNDWEQERIIEALAGDNFLDADCAIRVAALREVGGWPAAWVADMGPLGGHFDGSTAWYEDWALWQRLAAAGATFRCVPEETWRYRTGDWGRITG